MHGPHFRWTTIGLLALSLAASGCSRWIDLRPSASASQEAVTDSLPEHERVPLLLNGFRMTQNGAPQNPSTEIERRIVNEVQDTRLFSALVATVGSSTHRNEKVVTARITFDETIDPHAGEAAWKGILIGASMFLLSPVIELHYDYSTETGLELERWDGAVKRYVAQAGGTVYYHLFGATPIMLDELKGRVTEACLADLMDQLVRDTGFYIAGNTPLPEPAERVVTVTRRSTRPASSPVVPIALPPTP